MWRTGGEVGFHTDAPPIHPHSKNANLNNQGVREVPERAKIFFSSKGMVETTAGTSQRLCVCAKLLQSCPTLCDPVDCSLPGSVQTSKLETHWEGPWELSTCSRTLALAERSAHLTWALGPLGSPTLPLISFPIVPGVELKAPRTPSGRCQQRIAF